MERPHSRVPRTPVPLAALGVGLLATATFAGPLARSACAQRAGDDPAYLAAVLTPVGASVPAAAAPLRGEPAAEHFLGLGLEVGYTYAHLSQLQKLPVHTLTGGVGLTALSGRVSVSARGGYMAPDCGAHSADCDARISDGHTMAGASGALRLARWQVNDVVSPGVATLSLLAEAGVGQPKGARARAAAAGPCVAFVGSQGTLRVLAYAAPEAVWGELRVDDADSLARELGPGFPTLTPGVPVRDVRFMATGGLSLESTRTGLGLHAGIRHIVLHGATPRWDLSLTWRSTKARRVRTL